MEEQLRTMRIIWGAILASTGVYAAMLVFEIVPPQAAREQPPFAGPFAVLAVVLAVVSFVLPKLIHKQSALATKVPIVEEPMPGVFPAGYRQAAPEQKVFADRAAALRAAVMCYQTPLILGIALSEAIALFGFILGFLGFAPIVWAPFMVGGAALIAVRFPTEARVVAAFEEALGAKVPPSNDARQGFSSSSSSSN